MTSPSNDEVLDRLQEPVLAGGLLVVDLSETEFIDGSVLTSLIQVDRFARAGGLCVTLQLRRDSEVARVLAISGLTRELLCAQSRQEAVRLARALSYVSSSSEDARQLDKNAGDAGTKQPRKRGLLAPDRGRHERAAQRQSRARGARERDQRAGREQGRE